MALADLYVVDFKQLFGVRDTHNIFTYERGADESAVDLVNAFIEDVVPKINTVQSPNMVNSEIKAYSLGNLSDMWQQALTGGGTNLGVDMLPLHDAVNFTLKVNTRGIRPGSKRISGIPEAYSTNGTIDDPAYIGQLNALKTAIGSGIGEGVDVSFVPVVIKRVKYNPDPERPDHWAYRFPEIGETPVSAVVGTALLNLTVSHQVSR